MGATEDQIKKLESLINKEGTPPRLIESYKAKLKELTGKEVKSSKIKFARSQPEPDQESKEVFYIDFLNKDKGHEKDRKFFDTFKDAEKWGKKEFEKFHPDMINSAKKSDVHYPPISPTPEQKPNKYDAKKDTTTIDGKTYNWHAYILELEKLVGKDYTFMNKEIDDAYSIIYQGFTKTKPPKDIAEKLKANLPKQTWEQKVRSANKDYFKLVDSGMIGGKHDFNESTSMIVHTLPNGESVFYNITDDLNMQKVDTDKPKLTRMERMRLQGSINEGETLLRASNKAGQPKRTKGELEAIVRSVNNARKKLGLPPTKVGYTLPKESKARAKKMAFEYSVRDYADGTFRVIAYNPNDTQRFPHTFKDVFTDREKATRWAKQLAEKNNAKYIETKESKSKAPAKRSIEDRISGLEIALEVETNKSKISNIKDRIDGLKIALETL